MKQIKSALEKIAQRSAQTGLVFPTHADQAELLEALCDATGKKPADHSNGSKFPELHCASPDKTDTR